MRSRLRSTHSSCCGVPMPTSRMSGWFSAMCSSTRSECGLSELEVAVVGAAHVEPRVPARAASAAASVDAPGSEPSRYSERPRLLAQGGDAPDPVGAGHAVRHGQPDQPRGQPHAVAVAVDEVGVAQRAPQLGVAMSDWLSTCAFT